MTSLLDPLRRRWSTALSSIQKLRYLRHVLPKTEWRLFLLFVALALVSGVLLLGHAARLTIVSLPKAGGTYTEVVVGSPALVNPLYAVGNPVDTDLVRLVYAGLLRVTKDNTLVPDLAEQFTVSPDKKTYTVRLREHATWHDGKPVRADDVVFTLQAIQNPLWKSPLAKSFQGVTITAIDERTVQLSLREAFAPFLETLTVGILPKHLWKDVQPQTATLAEFNFKPIGSGPFRFHSFVKDKKGTIKSYTLERFDHFLPTPALLTRLQFLFAPSVEEAQKLVDRERITGLGATLLRDNEGKVATRFLAHRLPLSQYTALFFNQEKQPVVKEKKVRQALAHALDREAMIADALRGNGTPIAGPILLGALGYTTDVETYPLDTERANALLDDAGWKTITREDYTTLMEKRDAEKKKQEEALAKKTEEEQKKQGANAPTLRDVETTERPIAERRAPETETPTTEEEERLLETYRKKGEEILTLTLSTVETPETRRVAEMIREAWERLGVRVLLDIRKENFVQDVLQPRTYEMLLFGILVGRDPDPYPFWHSSQTHGGGGNLALFSKKDVDVLLEDARRENDEAIRSAKYEQFQKLLTAELPAHFLYTPTYTFLLDPSVKGFNVARISKTTDRFLNIEEWYVKTRLALRRK